MSGHFSFVLEDSVRGEKLTPSTISLSLFNEFNGQVAQFLRGQDNTTKKELNESRIEIVEGSYILRVFVGVITFGLVQADIERLQRQGCLGDIDPVRAEIIEKWQSAARKNKTRHYLLSSSSVTGTPVRINASSDFYRSEDNFWVATEEYLFGTVTELGGSTTPNIHITLEDGSKLIVTATESQLKAEINNRLYHNAMLHVRGKQNLHTGEFKELELLEFINYFPKYDELEFERMVEKGTRAWRDIPDSAAWVDMIRGNEPA